MKGKEVSQTRYDAATESALAAIATAFEDAGLPSAEIEATGTVSYRATNPRGGHHSWSKS